MLSLGLLRLGRLSLGFPTFLGLLGFLGLFGSLVSDRGCLLSLNDLVTFDGTHTTDSLGMLVGSEFLGLGRLRLGMLSLGALRLGRLSLGFPTFLGLLGFLGLFGSLVSDRGCLLSLLDSGLMNLRRGLLSLNDLVTFDGTHTTDSLGMLVGSRFLGLGRHLRLGRLSLGFPTFLGLLGFLGLFGSLVSDRGCLLSLLDSGLMNLRRGLLSLNDLVTFDGTHTTDSLGMLVGSGLLGLGAPQTRDAQPRAASDSGASAWGSPPSLACSGSSDSSAPSSAT